jgi:hypothetical protein
MFSLLAVALILSPPPRRPRSTALGGDDWRLALLPITEAKRWCRSVSEEFPFLVTRSPQGWIQSTYRNETRVLMHFVEERDVALIRRFVSRGDDPEAVRPTLALIKNTHLVAIDWTSLVAQPRWNLCARHYLSEAPGD